jgi:hypothetical protein
MTPEVTKKVETARIQAMKELFRTKNETWKEIQSNLLFIGAAELLIYNVGLQIKYRAQAQIDLFTPIVGTEYGIYYK